MASSITQFNKGDANSYYALSGIRGSISTKTPAQNLYGVTLYDSSGSTISSTSLVTGSIIPIYTSTFTVGNYPNASATASSSYNIRFQIAGTTYYQTTASSSGNPYAWTISIARDSYFLIVITGSNTFEFISDPRQNGYINPEAVRIPIEGNNDPRNRSDISNLGKYVTTKILCANKATGSTVISATDATFKAGNYIAYTTSGDTTTTASATVGGSNLTNTDTGAKLPGYWPVRIVGWYTSTARLRFTRMYIDQATFGSAYVSWMIYCAGTANQESNGTEYTGHGALYILWERG